MDDNKLKQLIFAQRPVPGQAFDLRVSQQAQRLTGETQPMKKRISVLAVVAAAILSLALVGAMAELMGANLFELFGQSDKRLAELAPKAVLNEVSPITVQSPELGTTTAGINSAYYDGQSLMVAYAIQNGRYMEVFSPTPEQLAQMEKTDNPLTVMLMNPQTDDILRQWNEATAAGTPFGYVQYNINPHDHTRTPEGLDLPPYSETYRTGEDGQLYAIREYVSPLPEGALDLEKLDIEIGLFQITQYHYYDGQQAYTGYERKDLAPMRATVWQTDAPRAQFTGEGSFLGRPITVQVSVSAVSALLTLEMHEGMFPALPEDAWYGIYLRDEQHTELRPREGSDGNTNRMVISFEGTGTVPEKLEMQLRVDAEGGALVEAAYGEPVFMTLQRSK